MYPILFVLFGILFKRLVLGRFQAGPRTGSVREQLRYWFCETMFSQSEEMEQVRTVINGVLGGVADIPLFRRPFSARAHLLFRPALHH